MGLRKKKKKLSIHVILNPCKASGDEIYSLAIRVLYCRKKEGIFVGQAGSSVQLSGGWGTGGVFSGGNFEA